MRWKIEVFHKILKSGCRAEQAKLRTTARLSNLLALLCVVGWRVYWLTMAARVVPDAGPEVAFTPAEVAVLDQVAGDPPEATGRTVAQYLLVVAKLGGYLAEPKTHPLGTWSCGEGWPASLTWSWDTNSRHQRVQVVGNCKPVNGRE